MGPTSLSVPRKLSSSASSSTRISSCTSCCWNTSLPSHPKDLVRATVSTAFCWDSVRNPKSFCSCGKESERRSDVCCAAQRAVFEEAHHVWHTHTRTHSRYLQRYAELRSTVLDLVVVPFEHGSAELRSHVQRLQEAVEVACGALVGQTFGRGGREEGRRNRGGVVTSE